MKTPSFIKNALYSALVFFGTLLMLSVGYAAFTTLQSSDAGPGKSLTSTMMQTVIGNLSDLDSRVSGISSTVSALQVSTGNLWTANGGNISYTGGNVGIGTATPGALVHVYKESGNNAEIGIQSNAGANKHWAVYNDRGSNSLRFWNNDGGAEKNILTLANDGKMGIGTVSPMGKLSVGFNNGDQLNVYSPGDNILSIQTSLDGQPIGNYGWNAANLSLQPLAGIVTMAVNGTGAVGIGTNSP